VKIAADGGKIKLEMRMCKRRNDRERASGSSVWKLAELMPTSPEQCEKSGNTTHGSGWIVQVQSTQRRTRDSRFSLFFLPSRRGERKETKLSGRRHSSKALGLNNPPLPCACEDSEEYHPRQWVDRSGAAYNSGGAGPAGFPISLPSRREGREGKQNGNSGCATCVGRT